MKCVIYCNGKKHRYSNLVSLAIQFESILWVFDPKKSNDKELRFTAAFPGWKDRTLKGWRLFRKKTWGTQADAANALGVSQSFLSKVERGERQIPIEMLVKFVDHGMDMSFFGD